MFERFTDRARRVVVLAQHEARTLGHDYIGTEHLLLGLIDEGAGVATTALTSMGINLDEMRQAGRTVSAAARAQARVRTSRSRRGKRCSSCPREPASSATTALAPSIPARPHPRGRWRGAAAGRGRGGPRPGPAAGHRAAVRTPRSRLGHRSPARRPGRGRTHGPADLDRHAAERHRAAAQAVSPGMTAHSTRLSPRCQSVPTSAKPAALNASTWVASSVTRLVVTRLGPAAGPFGDVTSTGSAVAASHQSPVLGCPPGSAACPRAGQPRSRRPDRDSLASRAGGRRRAAGRRGAARRLVRRTGRAARARTASAERWCSPRRPAPGFPGPAAPPSRIGAVRSAKRNPGTSGRPPGQGQRHRIASIPTTMARGSRASNWPPASRARSRCRG